MHFRKGYRYKHETTAKELIKFSLVTLIVTNGPREALRALSKENGARSAKGLDRIYSLPPCILGAQSMQLLFMKICEGPGIPISDILESSESEFHRA
jgi:hypothetical protein